MRHTSADERTATLTGVFEKGTSSNPFCSCSIADCLGETVRIGVLSRRPLEGLVLCVLSVLWAGELRNWRFPANEFPRLTIFSRLTNRAWLVSSSQGISVKALNEYRFRGNCTFRHLSSSNRQVEQALQQVTDFLGEWGGGREFHRKFSPQRGPVAWPASPRHFETGLGERSAASRRSAGVRVQQPAEAGGAGDLAQSGGVV